MTSGRPVSVYRHRCNRSDDHGETQRLLKRSIEQYPLTDQQAESIAIILAVSDYEQQKHLCGTIKRLSRMMAGI